MENNQSVLKHFFNIGFGTAINLVLGLLSTPLITRIADPSEYGELAIFNTYADLALAFLYFGLDRGLVRFFYDKDDKDSKRNIIWMCILIPIISAIILSIFYLFLTYKNILDKKFELSICFLLCFYVLITIFNRISTLVLTLTYKSKEFSICSIIQKIIYVIVILAYAQFINNNYLLMLILASIISVAIASFFAIAYAKEYWKLKDFKFPINKNEILLYSIPFIPYSIFNTLLDSVDKLMLEHYCSSYEVGIYNAALNMAGIFLIVKTIFETMWFPMQTEHFVKDDDRTFIEKGNRYITIILFFVCANVVLFRNILSYFLGESFRQAKQIIPMLFLSSSFLAISDTTISGIDYSKKSYLHSIIAIISCAVSFVSCRLLIPNYGAKGASIAVCLALISFLILRIYYSNKYYYIDYKVKKLALSSTIIFVYSLINTFAEFSIFTLFGYVISIMSLFIIYKKDIFDIFDIVKGLIPNKKQ